MLKGIHSTFYWAENMDETVAFWRDVLGLPLRNRVGDDWAAFTVDGLTLSLHGTRGASRPAPGATVVFEVDDLERVVVELRARGAAFEGDIAEVPETGRFAAFRDPSGNLLQLFEPSRGTIGEAGHPRGEPGRGSTSA